MSNEELCRRIKNGDKYAENELIRTNSGLIKSIADKHRGVCETDDLIQAGSLALFRAAKTFDADKGASFITYASNCISNAMTDLIRSEMRHIMQRADCSLDENLPDSDECYIDYLAANGGMSIDEMFIYYEEQYDMEEHELFFESSRVQAYMDYRFGTKGEKRRTRKETAGHFHITLKEARDIEAEAFGWLLFITYSPNRITEKEKTLVDIYLTKRKLRYDSDSYSHHILPYWYREDRHSGKQE